MFFGQWNKGESEAGTRVGQGLREVPACSCLRLVSYKLLVAATVVRGRPGAYAHEVLALLLFLCKPSNVGASPRKSPSAETAESHLGLQLRLC